MLCNDKFEVEELKGLLWTKQLGASHPTYGTRAGGIEQIIEEMKRGKKIQGFLNQLRPEGWWDSSRHASLIFNLQIRSSC